MTHGGVEWTSIELAILPFRQSRFKADRKLVEIEFALDI